MHYKGYSNTSRTWVFIIGGILLIAGLLFGCGGSEPETTVKPCDNTMLKARAAQGLRDHMTKLLKSPSSADFCSILEHRFVTQNDSAWIVEAYVDSKNSFGAELRTHYSAFVEYSPTTDRFQVSGFEYY